VQLVGAENVTRIRWNHKKGVARLAVGCSDGSVFIWTRDTKAIVKIPPPEVTPPLFCVLQ
jgi:hypothetical protein